MSNNALFTMLIKEQLMTLYKSKNIEVENTEESLLLNINKLAENSFFTDANGMYKKYIPLAVKELAWKLLFPDGSIIVTTSLMKYPVDNNDICCTATCHLYRNMEEREKGLHCAMLEKDFCQSLRYVDAFKNDKERFEALRPYAQAIVTSHCLTKFGIGLGVDSIEEDSELTSDTPLDDDDFSPIDEEVNTEINNGKDEDFLQSFDESTKETTVEKPTPAKRGRKKKEMQETSEVTEQETSETITPAISLPEMEIVDFNEVSDTAVTNDVQEEDAQTFDSNTLDDGVQTSLFDTEKPAEDEVEEEQADYSAMTLLEALNHTAEVGKCVGQTLGSILDNNPVHFKFLYNKAKERFSLKGQKALDLIVDNNDEARKIVMS